VRHFTRFRKTLHEFDAGIEHYDLVYYDAFAPRKQPEMWTEEVLQKTVNSLRQGGLLTTYCANGQFKRNLKSMGLSLQNPPGIGGRKEITLGRKILL
jgi:tRNA U34 5-methylaminomethyl-2-thiouridine-forming methyltransferase MnmC